MKSPVTISFKDIDSDEKVRTEVEERCELLGTEFPETTHFEINLSVDGVNHTAHGHVTGNHTEVAGQAEAPRLRQAADKLLDSLERQLRKVHDKKIFSQRRVVKGDGVPRLPPNDRESNLLAERHPPLVPRDGRPSQDAVTTLQIL